MLQNSMSYIGLFMQIGSENATFYHESNINN